MNIGEGDHAWLVGRAVATIYVHTMGSQEPLRAQGPKKSIVRNKKIYFYFYS